MADGDMDEYKGGAPVTNSADGYNPVTFDFIRDDWIRKEMKKREKEFTEEKTLRMFMGTWNVNAKKPTEDLAMWLFCDSPYPDIYAIGFQEIVDLNAVNLVSDHTASKPWEKRIESTLKNQYVQIASQHLVGLSLCVYVKKELLAYVREVQDDTVGVGIMGVGGNKGGVAISFQMFDSTFCVVNAHLAAHKGNVQGRNSDYHNICKRLAFPVRNKPGVTRGIFNHDYVFWIGDLNYRLNLHDMEAVYQKVDGQDWPYLLAHDQLILEKAAGNAFKNFIEPPIDFAPTYKYQPGTHLYEKREDKKRRFPAWCDRIQWLQGSDVKCLFYRRAELLCSDHKPVCGFVELKAKIQVREKHDAVYASLVRQLDQWENENIPKVAMSKNGVHFDQVYFDTPQTETLVIENTGQVIVQFRFVPKLTEARVCKPWLSVTPEYGIIPPNETVTISLTTHVTRETAQPLNTEEETFDDILIFRLEHGRDYFITVTGAYNKSCFGSTIEYLVKSPAPIRYTNPTTRPTKVLTLPKELWRIVDYLFPKALDEEDIFLTQGDAKQIDRIRECLDTGQEFGHFDIHSMAEALIRFLSSLAEPLFPRHIVDQFQETANLTAWCKQALMQLTAPQYNAFIYVTAFLREVLKHHATNKVTVDQLVLVFSACLMQTDVVGKGPSNQPKAIKILKHFLTSDEFV